MCKETPRVNKGLDDDLPSLYVEKIGANHIIDEIAQDGKIHRSSGKLIAVLGSKLLFEKSNGCRFLIDPLLIGRIIEIEGRGRR